ncbi:hypothetical protein [Flavobacterium hercynium]|uniref:Peptidase S74 domain-containing protein n=1 Tax=Flavobacterium hercynium TaxID=387094 RepID=A0A226GU34_9FLAO|nr:hypothetical protein [Flavobacterium hercynium]OXA84961.1 hypothetical protein B0A66_20085 [Flavobacterium hercynium]SMP35041.1 hypothetical protein SAMN06265346_11934 [Flavobacterium hercynium]
MKQTLLFIVLCLVFSTTTQAQFRTNGRVEDLNTMSDGFKHYIVSALNKPTNYGTVLGLSYISSGQVGDSDWRTQLGFGTENEFYYRQSTNTAGQDWTPWKKIFHSGNLNSRGIDFKANQIIAKELVLSNTETNVVLTSIGNSYINSGNVGIGTANPQNKLDVKGTIRSQEVKVELNNWPDFVFKKEYTLPTLIEVEKHITEKGHLENIPSEKEVLKNGINLGEMDAKLLQKIEELTLYVIELNKKIEIQNQELEGMKKKLDYK